MKIIQLFSLLLFGLFLNSCNSANSAFNLSAANFSAKINQLPDAPILDVRTPEEFAKGHLKNAKNVDWNGEDFQNKIAAIDKTKPVFVYCLSGGRSSSAANKMRDLGFKEVFELDGGIMKWRGANLPETVENSTASEGMKKVDFEKLVQSDKIILIDFYADWCAPCKKMKPYLEEISKEMATTVKVIRINADDNQALCKELNIDALPILQVYKNGQMTWSNQGYISKEEVVTRLK